MFHLESMGFSTAIFVEPLAELSSNCSTVGVTNSINDIRSSQRNFDCSNDDLLAFSSFPTNGSNRSYWVVFLFSSLIIFSVLEFLRGVMDVNYPSAQIYMQKVAYSQPVI